MDNETFEQVEIPKSITGEQYKLLKENLEVTILFMEEKPISLTFRIILNALLTTDAAIKKSDSIFLLQTCYVLIRCQKNKCSSIY